MALKQAYVDVARNQSEATEPVVIAQEISAWTGIPVVEAVAMMQNQISVIRTPDELAQLAIPHILQAWHTDPEFTGPYGVLRDLNLDSESVEVGEREQQGTLSALIRKYGSGVPTMTLLNEMLRTKCVQDVGSGFYRAVTRTYVYDPISTEGIRRFAHVVHNLCGTLEINNRPESKDGKGLIERTVFTPTGLTKQHLGDFDAYIRGRAQTFAHEVDDWLTSHQESETHAGTVKTGIGIYHYVINDLDEYAFLKQISQ